METDDYCRQIEAHLCRTNEGHLVRISGPAFDMVCQWAAMGVPIKVAFQGIDRHVQRVSAKGGRRRPVRIEFCEADVLDAFDAWRRAVGVTATADNDGGADAVAEAPTRRAPSLSTHIDRVIVRLTALRTGPSPSSEWDSVVDQVVRRLDALHPQARHARGPAREPLIAELASLDARLIDAARTAVSAVEAARIQAEADGELEPFRGRMDADTYRSAHERCTDRILRERLKLPVLTLD